MLIYLVRHALSDYNTDLPYHTVPGPPLSDEGVRQAQAAAQLLGRSGLKRVVSSPLRRCLQTAGAIAGALSVEPEVDDDLGEMQPGESPESMKVRMLRAVLSQVDATSVALVSHAAPLEHLLLALTHNECLLPPPGDRGARIGTSHVWQLHRRDGRWQAEYLPVGGVQL